MNFDFKNTLFSYIPNTASTAFYGLVDGINEYLIQWKTEEILKLGPNPTQKDVSAIISVLYRRKKF